MFSIERHVGRLCEVRIAQTLTLQDMNVYRAKFTSVLQSVPGKVVFVNDVRAVESVSPEVEEQGVQLMRAATPKIERAGIIVSTKGQFGMQMLRATMRTEASSVRRVFQAEADLERWLDDILTAPEQKRLREFLSAVHPK